MKMFRTLNIICIMKHEHAHYEIPKHLINLIKYSKAKPCNNI